VQTASLPAFARYSITNRKGLAEVIRRVRAQGFAITNQEYMLHILGAAVPGGSERGTAKILPLWRLCLGIYCYGTFGGRIHPRAGFRGRFSWIGSSRATGSQ
jgi:hypothetical protein